MAFAFVQVKTATGSGTSLAAAYDSNNTAGNLLVAGVTCRNNGSTVSLSTDTAGNTWAEAIEDAGTDARSALQYAANCAGSANTVTANYSGSVSDANLIIAEYSGVTTSSPLDAQNSAIGNSTSPSVNVTTVFADTLIIGVVHGTYSSLTAGGSYTERAEVGGNTGRAGLEDRAVSSANTYAVDWTAGSVFNDYAIVAASFKGIQTTWEQEGFRFRNDDGSESAATWLVAQDTNITQPTSTNTRLRILVDTANSDPATTQMQLECKLSTDSTYKAIEPLNTAVTATPVIEATNSGETSVNGLTHTISLPASIIKGELLVIVFTSDGNPTCSINKTTYPGWVKLGQTASGIASVGAVFAKIAVGSDTAPVVDTTASEQTTHISMRISGAGWPVLTQTSSVSTNANPPNLDVGYSANYRWIACYHNDATTQASAAPTNYSNLTTKTATNVTGASTAIADRALAASSEDPGAFTNVSDDWVAGTLAIPPADNIPRWTNSSSAAAVGTTSLSIPYPDCRSGDLLVMCISNKYPNNGPSTPNGWIAPSNNQGNGGSGSAGVDSGTVYSTIFVRVADGTESGSVTVTLTSANAAIGTILCYTRPAVKWTYSCTNGADNSAGTSWSVTAGANPTINAGDIVVACSAINSDAFTYASQSMSATGVTFSNHSERIDTGTTQGQDCGIVVSEHRASAGPASAAPVFTMTASSSGANAPAGATVFLRITAQDQPIVIKASSNITASGENTTGQLTAPASGSFGGGRIQDDENPADTVDLATNDYGEWEWCLQATSTATNGDIYQFRLTRNGTVLDTYTVTPQWTIGAADSPQTLYGDVAASLIITAINRAVASKIGRSTGSILVNGNCVVKKNVSVRCSNNLVVSNTIRGKSTLTGKCNNSLIVGGTSTGFSKLVGQDASSLIISNTTQANKIAIGSANSQCNIFVSNVGKLVAAGQSTNSLIITGTLFGDRGVSATSNFIISIADSNIASLILSGRTSQSLLLDSRLSGNSIVHPYTSGNLVIQATNRGNIIAQAQQTSNLIINNTIIGGKLLTGQGNIVLAISTANVGFLKLAGKSANMLVINDTTLGNLILHPLSRNNLSIAEIARGNIVAAGFQASNLVINNNYRGSLLSRNLVAGNLAINCQPFGVMRLSVSDSSTLRINAIIDAERIPGVDENEIFFGNVEALLRIVSQVQGNIRFAARSNQNLFINSILRGNIIFTGKTNNTLVISTLSEGYKSLIGSTSGLLRISSQSQGKLIAAANTGGILVVNDNIAAGLKKFGQATNTLQLSSAYLGNIKTGVKSSGNLSIFSSVTPLRKLGGNISNSLSIIDSIQGNRILVSAVSTILSISPSVVARLISSGQISASLIIDVITDAELILPAVVIITFNGIVNPLIVNSLYINPLIQNTLDVNAGFSENMLIAVDGVDINMNIPLGLIFEAQV